MPPIRERKASLEAQQNTEEPSSPDKSDKSTSPLDKERKRSSKRQPSINTRASRVGVTNFINVLKSLNHGGSITYFPITKETLQQYIDSKRKAQIKAGSLEQYLQHIQAYNIALGHGWDGQAFGPVIKKALDELRIYEEEIFKSTSIIQPHQSTNFLSTPVMFTDIIVANDSPSEAMNIDGNLFTINEDEGRCSATAYDDCINRHLSLDEQENSSKVIYIVCFDASTIPVVILDQRAKICLDNLNSTDPLQNLRQLYLNVSTASLPKSWGVVDTQRLYYRNETRDDSLHYGLINVSTYNHFWNIFNDERETIKEIQLVVYRNPPIVNVTQRPIFPISQSSPTIPRHFNHSQSFGEVSSPVLKSVTVRSNTKVYKQRIAVADTTTFSSIITFAIKVTPPPGKQFIVRTSDGSLEYMHDDLIREVITGVEHIDLVISLENIGSINFDDF